MTHSSVNITIEWNHLFCGLLTLHLTLMSMTRSGIIMCCEFVVYYLYIIEVMFYAVYFTVIIIINALFGMYYILGYVAFIYIDLRNV